jgi:hypothetical protein
VCVLVWIVHDVMDSWPLRNGRYRRLILFGIFGRLAIT